MYPLPTPKYAASVARRVAEGVVELLREPADADSMFAASPRFPPPGGNWRPLPYVCPRLSARLPWMRIGGPSGSGYGLLRQVLLTLANFGVLELELSPMAGSRCGRIRFLRLTENADRIDLRRVFRQPRRPRYRPWQSGVSR